MFMCVYVIFGIPSFGYAMATLGEECAKFIMHTHTIVRKGVRYVWYHRNNKLADLLHGTKERQLLAKEGSFDVGCGEAHAYACVVQTVLEDARHFPLFMAFAICFAWVCALTVFFSMAEQWSYGMSFYYVYESLTTIGLGEAALAPRVYTHAPQVISRHKQTGCACPASR
jgi:hypothetical protein